MSRAPAVRLFGDDEIIVDLFAGGGGASVGIERATGRSPDIAINHDKEAISMHRVNHPGTQHYIENVWRVDPRKVVGKKSVALMWLSPDCKHFSKAKGGKPHRSKRVRSLANVAVYWAKALKSKKPKVIVLENVEEFQTWGPLIPQLDERGRPVLNDDGTPVTVPCPARKGMLFRRFVKQLQKLGYEVDHRELVAADYGAPTSRKRLFLIARCDGKPIVWPDATHGPRGALPYRTAAECIDFNLPCPSIFERKKPLAENTQKRIARGIEKFVKRDPFIVPVTHPGDQRVHSIHDPLRTITGAHRGEFALVQTKHAPFVTAIDNGSAKTGSVWPAEAPLPTITLENRFAVAVPFLKPRYGEDPKRNGGRGQAPRVKDVRDPMPTVVPTGNGGDLVLSFLAKHNAGHEATGQPVTQPLAAVTSRDSKALMAVHIAQFNGDKHEHSARGGRVDEPLRTVTADPRHALVASSIMKMRGDNTGHRVDAPLQTISAQGNHFAEVRAFLMKYHASGGQWGSCNRPMPTVVANDSLALVMVKGEPHVIVDIGMRMLKPRELFNSHDFPATYRIEFGADGERMTHEAQVRMCGNSVPPPMAEALVRAQFGLHKGRASSKQAELLLEAA